MRRTLIIIALLTTLFTSLSAHTIGVGYVNKQVGTNSDIRISGKGSASVAVKIAAEDLKLYQGNQIQTVRVSMPETKKFVDSIVVWVRKDLNGENLATGKVTRFSDDGFANLKGDWNEVALSNPYDIPANTPLYVGYTYYQRTSVPASRIVDTKRAETSYVQLGSGADWDEYTTGTLAIEAGVDGPTMPQNDFWLMAAKGFILGDGTRQIEARVYNRGQEASSTLTFTATGASLDNTSYVNAQILPDQLDTLLINLPAGTDLYPGDIVNVTLAQVNGNDDVYAANNSSDATFNYLRILLLEEFTTEKCPNCPGAAEKIHNLLYGPDNLERQVAVVCHHAGYNTDGFTTSTDLAYEWFYNNEGGTYAPALMYNRTPQTTTSEGTSPVSGVGTQESIKQKIENIINQESALVITAQASYEDDDTRICVTVTGKRLRDFGLTKPRITVFLTEDNVLAGAQAGTGTDTYYHQHLMRGINSTWGEVISWEGDSFTYTCAFDLDEDWKKNDLKVIASVGDYDSTNPANCQIENTAMVKPYSATSIKDVDQQKSESVPTAYYSVNGQRLLQPQKGVNIVRWANGTTQKVVVK